MKQETQSQESKSKQPQTEEPTFVQERSSYAEQSPLQPRSDRLHAKVHFDGTFFSKSFKMSALQFFDDDDYDFFAEIGRA